MQVQMKKSKLIEILEKNKKEHIEIFNEAQDGYVKAAKKALSKVAKTLKQTGKLDLSDLHITSPTSYEESYDDAIELLKHTEEDVITLSQSEFRSYVLDKWQWGQVFASSNSSYVSDLTVRKLTTKA